jgi:type IV pilus assembly protein PilN
MIRINLLAAERAQVKKKLTFQTGQKLTLACSLILVAAVLLIGWRYWSLTRESAQLDADISAAQLETARLRSLIEDLRKEQKGPVHMLDEISRALPPMLWLTEVKQVGADVVIDGDSTTQTGVSDFVNNLEASGYFKKSIDIVGTRTVPLPQPPGELVTFSLRAQFLTPGEAKPVAAVATAAQNR